MPRGSCIYRFRYEIHGPGETVSYVVLHGAALIRFITYGKMVACGVTVEKSYYGFGGEVDGI